MIKIYRESDIMRTIQEILYDFTERFKKEKTKNDYRRDIIAFLNFTQKNFLEINFEDCNQYIEYLKTKVDKRKLAISTAEKLYSQLYSFYNYLEQNKYISYNHFKKIKKPTASRKILEEKIITWDELDRLISKLKTYRLRDYAAIMMIFTSGLTINETINLKWNQFFIDESKNIGIKFRTKKGERYVKVHQDIWKLLQDYKEKELNIISQDHYVFLNNRGKRISDRWIRLVLEKACQEAKLDKIYSPKDLRHALAAYTLKKGASAKQVQEQLGWSSEKLAERYFYTIQQLEDNAIDYLNFSLNNKKP